MSENQFVSKFKTTEAVAVEQVKNALPDILSKAFGNTDIYSLWGVPLDKESNDDRLRVLLIKFLRARDLDISKAKEMLIDTLKWRKEFNTDTIIEEEFDSTVYNEDIGSVYKRDKQGSPVTYNFYGKIDQQAVFADVNTFVRWRIQLMEKGIQQIDFINQDCMLQVHDYEGVSLLGRTAKTKEATSIMIKLMQNNYPEFLSYKLFINVPWWGSKVFKLIRPLLPEATIKKFVISSSDELMPTLTTYISKEDLPPNYHD